MAATFTLSGDLATIVGANIDPKAVQVYVEASEPAITDTTAHVTRLGSVQATVNSDGTWTAPGLIATNATDIVPAPVAGQSFKYRVLIRYRDARTSTVKNLLTGWFDLTANLKFDAIDERQLTQVEAAFADDIIDQVQASVDAAVAAKTAAQTAAAAAQAVGTTNDTVIAGRINTPGSATATALSNSIAQAFNPDDAGYDIVLLAGQSNMEGFATDYDSANIDVPDDRIWQFGTGGPLASAIARTGTPMASRSSAVSGFGLGPGLEFARLYAQTIPLNRRVLLVPCAVGGSTFEGNSSSPFIAENSWKIGRSDVTTNLYDRMIAFAAAALAAAGPNARFVGTLWVQGETDGTNGTTGATYTTDILNLIDQLRTDLAVASLPFVLGQMVPEYLGSGTRTAINAAQAEIPRLKTRTAFCYGPNGRQRGDGNHYNAAGVRSLGRSMAEGLLRARVNLPGSAPLVPGAPVLTQTSLTSLKATWPLPRSRYTGWEVRRSTDSGATWASAARSEPLADATQAITGVASGASVLVQVRTVNEGGTSPWSPTGAITLRRSPNVAAAPSFGTATSSSQPLSWLAPATDSTHDAASSYRVEFKKTSDVSWSTFSTVTTLSTTVTALVYSTSYDYRVVAINVGGEAAASGVATGPTASPTPLVDNFNRSDSTAGLGTPSDGLAAWSYWELSAGVFSINANRASMSTPIDKAKAVRSLAAADGKVSARAISLTWTGTSSGNENAGVLLGSDVNNYVNAVWTVSGQLLLFKRVGGAFTQLGSTLVAGTVSAGDTVEIRKVGTTVTANVNGSQVATATVADAIAAGFVGISNAGTQVKFWDDFSAVQL